MITAVQQFTEMLVARANRRAIPEAPIPVHVPTDDPAPMMDAVGRPIGDAEGQSFVIEYQGLSGPLSRRRVTVWGLKRAAKTDVPLLVATCHERNAQRTFRVDRIRCCIDYDGEVHDDVPAFLFETFGMDPGWASVAVERRTAWADIRDLLRHEIVLLSALSHCDGLMCDGEVLVARDHGAHRARASHLHVDVVSEGKLAGYIRRQHPTGDDVRRAMSRVLRQDPAELTRFIVACVELIDADGVRHPEEVRLANDFAVEVLGHPVV